MAGTHRGSRSGQIGALLGGVALLVLLSTLPSPRPRAEPPPEPPSLTEVEKVRLVLLQATVTDRRGRPARGLGSADFVVAEDGRPQKIEVFAAEREAPIELAFLLDLSGSMRQPGRLDEAKRAIGSFVQALGTRDRFGLVCFADRQVAWVTEFSSDVERFMLRLQVQEAYGATALYDALAASPELVQATGPGRKALVLFTDGLDNASRLPALNAVWLARRVSVPIYVVAFGHLPAEWMAPENREGLRQLEAFTAETGGALFLVQDPRDLARAVGEIQEDLRFQYVIGYYPTRPAGDRAFRRIDLVTTQPQFAVRSRAGYYPAP